MTRAQEWISQTVAACLAKPMTTEAILKSLEKHVGDKSIGQGDGPGNVHSDRALARVQAVLEAIDQEMIERNDGPVMRQLWLTVADYLEKVLEARAAA